MPRVYLAGPMVFDADPTTIFDQMKALCLAQGLVGVAPLDNQIGLEGIAPGNDLLRQIVRADIALMDTLEAAVFCLDGFRRGPEMDAGTAFEIGYMKALGKPIAGWTRDVRPPRSSGRHSMRNSPKPRPVRQAEPRVCRAIPTASWCTPRAAFRTQWST
jgi:nucleoside 2-deoxyribosyltransferase